MRDIGSLRAPYSFRARSSCFNVRDIIYSNHAARAGELSRKPEPKHVHCSCQGQVLAFFNEQRRNTSPMCWHHGSPEAKVHVATPKTNSSGFIQLSKPSWSMPWAANGSSYLGRKSISWDGKGAERSGARASGQVRYQRGI